ncbi:MAG: Ldh family oxidoreductase [Bacillota bacterium]
MYNDIKAFCNTLLEQVGVSKSNAEIVSSNLVTADLRGVSSHGVARLPVYIKRIQLGLVNPHPSPKVVKSTSTTLLIDGDNGLGQINADDAMKRAVAMAEEKGQSLVGVRNTNHLGICADYVLKAAQKGMVGFCVGNASAHMAPWGGIKPILGTNPISVAVPAGRFPAIVLDMATSIVARGKILLAAKKGEKIPLGWALDKDGNPTEDSEKARLGTVLPFGGPKGYGLSLLVDILSGVMTGALFGSKVPSMTENFETPLNLGAFLGAFRIDNFMPLELFEQRIEELITEIKESPRAPGVDEIYLPGEIEHNRMEKGLKDGVKLDEKVRRDLNKLAESLNVTNRI